MSTPELVVRLTLCFVGGLVTLVIALPLLLIVVMAPVALVGWVVDQAPVWAHAQVDGVFLALVAGAAAGWFYVYFKPR